MKEGRNKAEYNLLPTLQQRLSQITVKLLSLGYSPRQAQDIVFNNFLAPDKTCIDPDKTDGRDSEATYQNLVTALQLNVIAFGLDLLSSEQNDERQKELKMLSGKGKRVIRKSRGKKAAEPFYKEKEEEGKSLSRKRRH